MEESIPSIKKSLDRLSSVAHRLNHETDALNWVIEDVGSQLQRMNLGVAVWDDTLLDAETEPSTEASLVRTRGWVVGHVKIKETWRLAVKQVRVEKGFLQDDPAFPFSNVYDVAEPIPLLRASRMIRVQAVRRLEPLLDLLAVTVDSYVDDITRAKSLVGD